MEKSIIIINGTGGAGKDTFVNFCAEVTGVLNVSTVDKVKVPATGRVAYINKINYK